MWVLGFDLQLCYDGFGVLLISSVFEFWVVGAICGVGLFSMFCCVLG